MKVKPIFTPMSERSFKFRTFQDPVLEQMVAESSQISNEFTAHPLNEARWLSFIGGSGTGKTYLANQLYQRAQRNALLSHHIRLVAGVCRQDWRKMLSDLRNGKYHIMEDACEMNFLFLDELAIEHDPSGFAADKLSELLGRRIGKWTVITSNLSPEKIAALDVRVMSRMIRDGNRLVRCETQDYALRDL